MLQIRRDKRINLGILLVLQTSLLKHTVYCDPSLEPSCLDDCNEGSQHNSVFVEK